MGNTRRKFDPEFRAGAVRYVRETGKPVAQCAKDLGVNVYTLHNWVQMDRLSTEQSNGTAAADGGVSESEREELARLRGEKAEWSKQRSELQMQVDVLKRSTVLWVREAMGR